MSTQAAAHKKVLRPILNVATDCFVYDKLAGDVRRCVRNILERDGGGIVCVLRAN